MPNDQQGVNLLELRGRLIRCAVRLAGEPFPSSGQFGAAVIGASSSSQQFRFKGVRSTRERVYQVKSAVGSGQQCMRIWRADGMDEVAGQVTPVTWLVVEFGAP